MGKLKIKVSPRDMSKIKVIIAKNKLNRAKHMKIWPNLRIQVGKPHPNLMKIGEHDLMSMGNKPITLDLKNNVKMMSKTSISTIWLSIFINNSRFRHQIKNLRPYLESGHQNTSSYVVKCQKSIVDMLIVDMRRCGKYKETLRKFHYSLEALERNSRVQEGDLGELSARDTGIPSASDCSQVILVWCSTTGCDPRLDWDRYLCEWA